MRQKATLFLIIAQLAFLTGKLAAQNLTRGPYLQLGTPSSMVIRWRTDIPSNSQINYGIDSSSLDFSSTDLNLVTEHEINLSNLNFDTKYFYSVGSTSTVLASGIDYFFTTAPLPGSAKVTRVWVLGDAGTKNDNQRSVRDAYYAFTGSTSTDLWIMLGDNAYSTGTDINYQEAVFDMYPSVLRNSVLWPAFGNHDGGSAISSTQSGVFYDIFTLPDNAQAGGTASGTEAYYSFEYANIHFVCLNSHDINGSQFTDMISWLTSDLSSHTQQWTIAFWHHPPYSKGSHNSDTESRLIRMREEVLPSLEAGGVDMVLSGHSHAYERSFLLDGHYGLSGTLTEGMILDNGDGREDGSGAYEKITLGPASHEGTVYIVAGSSGQTSGGSLNHPAMYTSLNILGSLIMDFNDNRLDFSFLDATGNIQDYLTMLKGQDIGLPVFLSFFKARQLKSEKAVLLEWKTNSELNNFIWQVQRKGLEDHDFEVIAEIAGQLNTAHQTNYSFKDSQIEYGDSYTYRLIDISVTGHKKVHDPLSISISKPENFMLLGNYPNPFNPASHIELYVSSDNYFEVSVYNLQGQNIRNLVDGMLKKGLHKMIWDGKNISGQDVASGTYFIEAKSGRQKITNKIVLVR